MTIKIEKKIVGYEVARPGEEKTETTAPEPEQQELIKETPQEEPVVEARSETGQTAKIIRMHEKVERPEALVGSTYKIKTPLSEHALYVTINDIVLNPGTPYEKRRPFEIFINSKNMDHFQWIVALTRIISAVFRKGGDITFLVEELHSVFDPQGGYFKKGGKYMPSLVAEIGDAIETHMKMIGLIKEEGLDEYQQKLVDQKRKEYEARQRDSARNPDTGDSSFPEGATLCGKCRTKAVVMMDGCLTCLNCGESKCG